MPLPPPTARRLLHTRQVRYEGFEREDGLIDIEATLLDTKTFSFDVPGERRWEAGDPIHAMQIRLVIDPQFVVHDIQVSMDDVPHGECSSASEPMRRVIGCSLRKGWRQAIEERLGKVQGCAHLRELLFNMGTVAFQTMARRLNQSQQDAGKPPAPMGGCLAWDPAGSMVARIYPQFHIKTDRSG
jgi:hypothetical protein